MVPFSPTYIDINGVNKKNSAPRSEYLKMRIIQ